MSDANTRAGDSQGVMAQAFEDDLSVPTRPKDRLDRAIDVLERVMPDLPMLGAMLLLLVVCLVSSGRNFGSSGDACDVQADPQSTADLARAVTPF